MSKTNRDHVTQNSRVLKIPRVQNFRDLGGYPTLDGRTIKWGVLFRSGYLTDVPPRGLKLIKDLNLSAIIDFRSTYETQRYPNRVPEDVRVVHLPVMDQANREMSREIRERIKNNHLDGFFPERLIIKAYRQFPTEFTPAYRTFMRRILDAHGKPILWHCAAGKDRTGYASAILLRLLGVDQEIIYMDYMLSNRYVRTLNARVLKATILRGLKAYRMIEPLLKVNLDWLEAAFETIDEEWGSFGNYVKEGLQISPAEVDQLKDYLLE